MPNAIPDLVNKYCITVLDRFVGDYFILNTRVHGNVIKHIKMKDPSFEVKIGKIIKTGSGKLWCPIMVQIEDSLHEHQLCISEIKNFIIFDSQEEAELWLQMLK